MCITDPFVYMPYLGIGALVQSLEKRNNSPVALCGQSRCMAHNPGRFGPGEQIREQFLLNASSFWNSYFNLFTCSKCFSESSCYRNLKPINPPGVMVKAFQTDQKWEEVKNYICATSNSAYVVASHPFFTPHVFLGLELDSQWKLHILVESTFQFWAS